ncbi:MAG: MlaD family protein [Gammaproteobacteria bacterium]|nr:MlaD family protein [Gammaproteobacteria bacterium]MCI0590857.1 MlaD family protein [Gammaproteobacteria bacterium]
MKREHINYLVVGVFVLAMAVALLVLLYQITGRAGPTDTYFVNYSNVSGIKQGTPVFYEGFQIGQVEDIIPGRSGGKTNYRVEVSVRKDWHIPTDSVARIVASGLISAVSINIREGKSETLLSPGDAIRGQEGVSLFDAVAEIADDFHQLSQKGIEPVLENLNGRINGLAEELSALIDDSVRPFFDKLNALADHPELIEDTRSLLVKLNNSADRLKELLSEENREQVAEVLKNIEGASRELSGLMAQINGTRALMDKLLLDMDALVTENQDDIRQSVADLQKSLQVVSEHIDAVAYHLEGSARNVHEFTREIREDPALLLRGAAPPAEGGAPEEGGRE